MASIRQLAYRDRYVWALDQAVSAIFDDCDGFVDRFVFPDMTTRVPLVIILSQEQWTILYSAILTGADLAYPFQTAEVEALFLQTVNCPMNVFCAALINCLENDPGTLAALLALLAEQGVTGGVGDPSAPISDGSLGENLLPAGYTCTDDKAFGMALAVVDSINEATTEVLQAIEILTNPLEIAAELADNVPGIGALSSGADVSAWIQDAAKEAYDLAWSTAVRDELACLLWCAFKGDCELTYDRIWEVYLSASDASPPTSPELSEWLVWLIALPFVASLSTVATISLLGLLAMRYGGAMGQFELGIRSLKTVIQLSVDESSSDWSIVCDPCSGWCYTWDLTIAQSDWTLVAGSLTGNGIQDTTHFQSNTEQHASILTMDVTGKNVTDIEFAGSHLLRAYFVAGWSMEQIRVTSHGDLLLIPKVDGGVLPYSNVLSGLSGLSGTLTIAIRDGIKEDGEPDDISLTDGYIDTVTLKGTGSNPFGANNC
jgi:hypothetical protein